VAQDIGQAKAAFEENLKTKQIELEMAFSRTLDLENI